MCRLPRARAAGGGPLSAGLALTWLLATGCAPGRLHLEPVAFPTAADPDQTGVPGRPDGPSVFLELPIDARPPSERQDARYVFTAPVPIVYYGELNLRPGAVHAVDRTLHDAVRAAGVPVADDRDDAELIVRPFIRSHHGSYDVSDAHWVSYATAGVAGTVGQFLYPAFTITELELRLELLDAKGASIAVRDVGHVAVRRRATALTWGLWSLWRRDPTRDMFADAFAEVHTAVGVDVAALVDAARSESPLPGAPPTEPTQHALAARWDRPVHEPDTVDPRIRLQYPAPRFSPLTGHDTTRGEVVGKLAFPLDTVGYEIALTDGVQALADLTVLLLPQAAPDAEGSLVLPIVGGLLAEGALGRLFNSASGGLRVRVVRFGDASVALEGRAGGRWLLSLKEGLEPAGLQAQAGLIAAWRPGGITWFARTGVAHVLVLDERPDLPGGTRALLGPGATVQLTPTVAVGLEVLAGAPIGDPGPPTVWPQLTLGLR